MASRVFLFTLRLFSVGLEFLREGLYFGRCLIRKRTSLVAENLFLRKQLAAYAERNSKPCRLSDKDRLTLLLLPRCFDWRRTLVVVKPETLVGWHRKAFQLFWRWKSRGGRPRVPRDLRALIAEMVRENPTWGQRRVASELALKLGIDISARTIRAYWPEQLEPSHRRDSQRWMIFVRNHAKAIVACDFAVAVTLRFQILYLFVVMDLNTRKLLHVNTTPHPNSAWTLRQLQEAIPSDHRYRWLIRRSGTDGRPNASSQDFGSEFRLTQTLCQRLAENRLLLRFPRAALN